MSNKSEMSNMSYKSDKLSFTHDLKYLSIIAIILFTLFYKFFIFGEVLIGGDLINQYIPYKHIIVEQIKSGEFPFWNPYTFSGRPLQADIQDGIFYPPNIPFLFLPVPFYFTLLVILHIFLGGIGMYYYTKEAVQERIFALIPAIIFVLSGFFMIRIHSGVVLFIITGAWAPLIFLIVNKWFTTRNFKLIPMLALLFSLQLLAGSPQIAFYTIFTVLLYILLRLIYWVKIEGKYYLLNTSSFPPSSVLSFPLVALFLALLITAIQTFPTYQFIKNTFERAGSTKWEYIVDCSINIKVLLSYIVPFFFYYPMKEDFYWGNDVPFFEVNAYLGILPLLFISVYLLFKFLDGKFIPFFNRNNKISNVQFLIFFWYIMLVLTLLLGFGKNLPIFRIFYLIVPGFNMFRDPARIMFLFTISVAFLTGVSAQYFAQSYSETTQKLNLKIGILSLLFIAFLIIGFISIKKVLIIMAAFGFSDTFKIPYNSILQSNIPPALIPNVIAVKNGILFAIGLFLLSVLLIVIVYKRLISKKLYSILIVIVLLFDLGLFARYFINTGSNKVVKDVIYKDSPVIEFLKCVKDKGRFTYMDDVHIWQNDQNQMEIYPNRGSMYNIYDARGFDPVAIKSYGQYFNVMAGLPIDETPGGFLFLTEIKNPQLLSLLNIRFILSYDDLSQFGYSLVKQFDFGLKIFENPKAAGWAYFRKDIPWVDYSNLQQVFGVMLSNKYNTEICAIAPKGYEYAKANAQQPAAPSSNKENKIQVVKYGASEKIYKVSAKEPQLMVFSEVYYPGWKVYVDGKRQDLIPVDYTLMGTFISPNAQEVRLIFQPDIFYRGAIISIVGLILTIALFFKRKVY